MTTEPSEYDSIDRRIVNALQQDGRATVLDVARIADAPVTTVQKRLERLRENGIITGYEPQIEYSLASYGLTAIFKLDLQGDAEELITRLRANEQLMSVYEVTGAFDVIAIGKYADTVSMNEQIKALLIHPSVRAANTSVVLDTIRENEPLELTVEDEDTDRNT
jgi:DNA-binding Lrp family transcriptional regulator